MITFAQTFEGITQENCEDRLNLLLNVQVAVLNIDVSTLSAICPDVQLRLMRRYLEGDPAP